MGRPKSSVAGLGTLGLTALNSRKLTKMKREFAAIQDAHTNNMEYIGHELRNIRDLHLASFAGLATLSNQITDLSKTSWEILDYIKEKDRKEEVLGYLKLLLINLEEEIERINGLSEDYPEYALLLIENLDALIEGEGLELERFKSMPPSDIKWAKSILDSIGTLHRNLFTRVKGM